MPFMTKAKAYTLIRQHLAFNNALSEDIIDANVDAAQTRYESGEDPLVPLPWFLLETGTNTIAAATFNELNAPERFIAFDDEWPCYIRVEEGCWAEFPRVSAAQNHFFEESHEIAYPSGLESGRPTAFVFDGRRFHFDKVPDQDYYLSIPCYRYSELALSEDDDSASLWWRWFPHLIVTTAALTIASSVRDMQLVQQLQVLEATYRRGYTVKCEEMKLSLRDVYVGTGA